MNKFKVTLLCILLHSLNSEGRVFSMGKESFAAYLRGTMGPKFTNTLVSDSSGSNVTLDSVSASNRSAEFGFIYASPFLNVRFGLEVVNPEDLKKRIGFSSAQAEYYSLTSETSVTTPKINFEVNLHKTNSTRTILILGAGYANLVGRNSYVFTSAGTADLSASDFSEDLRATTVSYEMGLGYEFHLADTTTLLLETGYRFMKFDTIKHNKDTTTLQGAVIKGDAAKNMDGSNRTLNLSNYYGGLSVRIWID